MTNQNDGSYELGGYIFRIKPRKFYEGLVLAIGSQCTSLKKVKMAFVFVDWRNIVCEKDFYVIKKLGVAKLDLDKRLNDGGIIVKIIRRNTKIELPLCRFFVDDHAQSSLIEKICFE